MLGTRFSDILREREREWERETEKEGERELGKSECVWIERERKGDRKRSTRKKDR
jgi:hypothetical protein